MKKFNLTLLSLAAIAFVGTSLLPAVAGEGCCGGKKEKASGEECSKDKAKAEAKSEEVKTTEKVAAEAKEAVEAKGEDKAK